MGSKDTRLTVLMFPWLAIGHISPTLELAKKLSERNFKIYICSTPINLVSIKNRITENYSLSIQLVELHLPSLPELPPHYHTTDGLPHHLHATLQRVLKMAKPDFSNILKTLNPDLLIHDPLQPWAAEVASSQNVPAVSLMTTSAAICTFFVHEMVNPGVEYPFPAIYLRDYEETKTRQMVQNARKNSGNDGSERPLRSSSNLVLIESFNEIEGKYIDYFCCLMKRKIVPVGSLVQDHVGEDEEGLELIEWLGKKEQFSTVFLAFGSEYFLSKEEIEEIAHGLELSKVNFIWVVRFPLGEKISMEEALPKGFLDRVGDRGVVVDGWAPQAKILGHPSIGGFASHCGWNSVLESMKFGVPIIAMPMQLDQPLNARLVTEVGVGVEVVRDDNGMLHREEVAKVIREVIIEKSGEDVRRRARELSENIRLKGEEEMDGVVEALVQLCYKNTEE